VFQDKVAVVTGSARGIGRAAAGLLAAGGAKVVVGDIDPDAAQQAAAEIGDGAIAHVGDITKDGVPDSLIGIAIDAFGKLDIVVNNAGYTLDAPIHKLSDADFQAMVEIHMIAPFKVLRAAAPYLREPAKQEEAEGCEVFRKVVNVTSMAAYGNAGQANYASSKAGAIGLTKALAREWAPLKINVNAVAFGLIDTRLTQAKTSDTRVTVGGRTVPVGIPEQTRTMMAAMIPLGRPGTVEEAAGGIAFLCSRWSDYVTGQVLNVGGGIPMGMSA
jgi:3-oxoacyl-[acyl-carrier protein] reductase